MAPRLRNSDTTLRNALASLWTALASVAPSLAFLGMGVVARLDA